jgi:general secretion pathway protein N
MRTSLALASGSILLLGALVIVAPATLLDGRLAAVTDGRLRLASASGTVWNGSGELRVLPGRTTIPVSWQLEAWPLLIGELRGKLGDEAAQSRATFTVGRDKVEVRDVALTVPAPALLRAAVPTLPLPAAGGNVGLRIAALDMRGKTIDGGATVRWEQASVTAPRPAGRIALGEVRFDATGQDGQLAGGLANTGGEVEIVGSAAIAPDGSGRLSATVRLRAGIDAERGTAINAALAAVGRPDGAGGYRLAWP